MEYFRTGDERKDWFAGQRLLAHIEAGQTRWARISSVLLNIGRWRVPEHRDSRFWPQRKIGDLGLWMDEIQAEAVNDLFNEKYGLGKYAKKS